MNIIKLTLNLVIKTISLQEECTQEMSEECCTQLRHRHRSHGSDSQGARNLGRQIQQKEKGVLHNCAVRDVTMVCLRLPEASC